MPQHLPIDKVCSILPNLSTLNLQYASTKILGSGGNRNSSMTYDRNKIGMKLSDTDSLRKTIASSSTLSSLIITNSQINDDAIRLLVNGLSTSDISTLIHIDVSHNQITTNGVRLLTKKFLDTEEDINSSNTTPVLSSLDVSDNRIHAEGGRAIGRILRHNTTLLSLNLRLNRLEDEGGRMIMEGLRENGTLRHLNLSSNALGSQFASALASVLEYGTCQLSSIDLSSNCLCEEDLSIVGMAMKENHTLVCLDVRMNGDLSSVAGNSSAPDIKANLQKEIDDILHRNELALMRNA
mmetsp:Transcript_33172/g.48694  ORF Transcript_33172/g.48694 Transcript_33172/m.48694 type:complete len:295 (+) Transcript_33172:163-1047(+)